MSKIVDLLKYALENFYPSRQKTVDNTTYPSLYQKYNEWSNHIYENGYWCIGVEDKDFMNEFGSLTRSINKIAYIITNENRLNLAIKLHDFSKTQEITIHVHYKIGDKQRTYSASGAVFNKNYTYIPLDEEITFENLTEVVVDSIEEVIENHVKYSSVQTITFGKDDVSSRYGKLINITEEEFNNLLVTNKEIILQKLMDTPEIIRNTNTSSGNKVYYGFRIRNLLPIVYDDTQLMKFRLTVGEDVEEGIIVAYEGNMEEIISSYIIKEDLTLTKFDYVEATYTLSSKSMYSGFKVRLIFEDIKGNKYTPARVAYIYD